MISYNDFTKLSFNGRKTNCDKDTYTVCNASGNAQLKLQYNFLRKEIVIKIHSHVMDYTIMTMTELDTAKIEMLCKDYLDTETVW